MAEKNYYNKCYNLGNNSKKDCLSCESYKSDCAEYKLNQGVADKTKGVYQKN
jgi:hypothetical protein